MLFLFKIGRFKEVFGKRLFAFYGNIFEGKLKLSKKSKVG